MIPALFTLLLLFCLAAICSLRDFKQYLTCEQEEILPLKKNNLFVKNNLAKTLNVTLGSSTSKIRPEVLKCPESAGD